MNEKGKLNESIVLRRRAFLSLSLSLYKLTTNKKVIKKIASERERINDNKNFKYFGVFVKLKYKKKKINLDNLFRTLEKKNESSS